MFERFTEGSRRTVVLAQEEARLLDHKYIGTEHLLAGLMRVEDGIGAQVLAEMGVRLEEVRLQIVRIVGRGEKGGSGQIPFTPRAKKVLERSLAAAQSLSMDMIGTEHILLGLTRETDGVAARILLDLGAAPTDVPHRVLLVLGHPRALAEEAAHATRRLRTIEDQLSLFDSREQVARIVGEASDTSEAVRELSRLFDLGPGQAEALSSCAWPTGRWRSGVAWSRSATGFAPCSAATN